MNRKLLSIFILMLVLYATFSIGAVSAHPTENAGGQQAGQDPNLAVATTASENSGSHNSNGVSQQPAHNPTCQGHIHNG